MLGQLAATSAKLKDTIDRLGLEHFMYLRKAGFSTEDANLLYPLIEKLGNIAKSVEIEERRGRKVELDLHMLVLNRLQELQQPNNVHFTRQGSMELAKEVKKHILKAIHLP